MKYGGSFHRFLVTFPIFHDRSLQFLSTKTRDERCEKKPEPKPGRMVRLGLPSEMQRGPFLRGKAGKATDHIRRFPEMGVPPNHLPSGKCLYKTMENHHF